MRSEIPDSLREKALSIANDIDADYTWDGQCYGEEQRRAAINLIAAALLDVQQATARRCAEICAEQDRQCVGDEGTMAGWLADAILREFPDAAKEGE